MIKVDDMCFIKKHKKHKKNLCFLCFSRILKFTYNNCYSNNFLSHKIKSINFHKVFAKGLSL